MEECQIWGVHVFICKGGSLGRWRGGMSTNSKKDRLKYHYYYGPYLTYVWSVSSRETIFIVLSAETWTVVKKPEFTASYLTFQQLCKTSNPVLTGGREGVGGVCYKHCYIFLHLCGKFATLYLYVCYVMPDYTTPWKISEVTVYLCLM